MRERPANADAIVAMLPLLPATFHILVALADEDRYYRLTPLGTAVAQAEAARLMDLVRMARARGLAPRKG
jgi:hypothetical protein